MPVLADTPLVAPEISDLKQRDLKASFEPKRLLDVQRSEANRRERERVQNITKAYEDLLEVCPKDFAEPKLSRIELVRRSASYVQYLTDVLQQIETSEAMAGGPVLDESVDLSPDAMRQGFMQCEFGEDVQRLERKRVICNARARVRCKGTKEAFHKLKLKIPVHKTEPELSRLSILRRATDYIALMTLLLNEDETEKEENIEKGEETLQEEHGKEKEGSTSIADSKSPEVKSDHVDNAGADNTQLGDTAKMASPAEGSMPATEGPTADKAAVSTSTRSPVLPPLPITVCSSANSHISPFAASDSDYFSNTTSTPTSTISNSSTFTFDCLPAISTISPECTSSTSGVSEDLLSDFDLSPTSWLSSELDSLLPCEFPTNTTSVSGCMHLPITIEDTNTFTLPTFDQAMTSALSFAQPSLSHYTDAMTSPLRNPMPAYPTTTQCASYLGTTSCTTAFATLPATTTAVSGCSRPYTSESTRCERESLAPTHLAASQNQQPHPKYGHANMASASHPWDPPHHRHSAFNRDQLGQQGTETASSRHQRSHRADLYMNYSYDSTGSNMFAC